MGNVISHLCVPWLPNLLGTNHSNFSERRRLLLLWERPQPPPPPPPSRPNQSSTDNRRRPLPPRGHYSSQQQGIPTTVTTNDSDPDDHHHRHLHHHSSTHVSSTTVQTSNVLPKHERQRPIDRDRGGRISSFGNRHFSYLRYPNKNNNINNNNIGNPNNANNNTRFRQASSHHRNTSHSRRNPTTTTTTTTTFRSSGNLTAHSFASSNSGHNPSVSLHAALVRERTRELDFYDLYQVLNEIRATKLSTIYKIRRRRRKKNWHHHHLPHPPKKPKAASAYSSSSRHHHPHHHHRDSSPAVAAHLRHPSEIPPLKAITTSSSTASSANDEKIKKSNLLKLQKEKFEQAFSVTRPNVVVDDNEEEEDDDDDDDDDDPPVDGDGEPCNKAITTTTEESTTTTINSTNSSSSSITANQQQQKEEEEEDEKDLYFALKVVNLDAVNESQIEQLKSEIEILKLLDHKNIINAHEYYQIQSHQKFMIVMELCTGGDLYRRMPYTERQVAYAMRQVLSAVDYMHHQHIIHRDIKMENIIWESNHPEAAVKAIDSGLSKRFVPPDNVFTERVGSLYSMSPETMKGVYTTQADLWSVGVCAYTMLSNGTKPFDGDSPKHLVANVLKGEFKFETPLEDRSSRTTSHPEDEDNNNNTNINAAAGTGKDETNTNNDTNTVPVVVEVQEEEEEEDVWTTITDHAKSFVSQLLVLEPEDRLNANTAKHHSWFYYMLPSLAGGGTGNSGGGGGSNSRIGDTMDNDNDSRRPEQQQQQHDGGGGGGVVVSSSSLVTSKEFKQKVFANMINFASRGAFCRLAFNVVAQRSASRQVLPLRKVFDEFNTLNTGTLSFREFKEAAVMVEAFSAGYSMDKLHRVFRRIDINRTKVINYTEYLASTLETLGPIPEYRFAEAFDLMDLDDTGCITRNNVQDLLGKSCGDLDRDERFLDQLFASVVELSKPNHISYPEFLFNVCHHHHHSPHQQPQDSHKPPLADLSFFDGTTTTTTTTTHPPATTTTATGESNPVILGDAAVALLKDKICLREELQMARRMLGKEFVALKQELALAISCVAGKNKESAAMSNKVKEDCVGAKENDSSSTVTDGFGESGMWISNSWLLGGMLDKELLELRVAMEAAQEELENVVHGSQQQDQKVRVGKELDPLEEWVTLHNGHAPDTPTRRELMELQEALKTAKYELEATAATTRTAPYFDPDQPPGGTWLDDAIREAAAATSSSVASFLHPPEETGCSELREELEKAKGQVSRKGPPSLVDLCRAVTATTEFFDAIQGSTLVEFRTALEEASREWPPGIDSTWLDNPTEIELFHLKARGGDRMELETPAKDMQDDTQTDLDQLQSTSGSWLTDGVIFFDRRDKIGLTEFRADLEAARKEIAVAEPPQRTSATAAVSAFRAELDAAKREWSTATTNLDHPFNAEAAWMFSSMLPVDNRGPSDFSSGQFFDDTEKAAVVELRSALEAASKELASSKTGFGADKATVEDMYHHLIVDPSTESEYFDAKEESSLTEIFGNRDGIAARMLMNSALENATTEGEGSPRCNTKLAPNQTTAATLLTPLPNRISSMEYFDVAGEEVAEVVPGAEAAANVKHDVACSESRGTTLRQASERKFVGPMGQTTASEFNPVERGDVAKENTAQNRGMTPAEKDDAVVSLESSVTLRCATPGTTSTVEEFPGPMEGDVMVEESSQYFQVGEEAGRVVLGKEPDTMMEDLYTAEACGMAPLQVSSNEILAATGETTSSQHDPGDGNGIKARDMDVTQVEKDDAALLKQSAPVRCGTPGTGTSTELRRVMEKEAGWMEEPTEYFDTGEEASACVRGDEPDRMNEDLTSTKRNATTSLQMSEKGFIGAMEETTISERGPGVGDDEVCKKIQEARNKVVTPVEKDVDNDDDDDVVSLNTSPALCCSAPVTTTTLEIPTPMERVLLQQFQALKQELASGQQNHDKIFLDDDIRTPVTTHRSEPCERMGRVELGNDRRESPSDVHDSLSRCEDRNESRQEVATAEKDDITSRWEEPTMPSNDDIEGAATRLETGEEAVMPICGTTESMTTTALSEQPQDLTHRELTSSSENEFHGSNGFHRLSV